jgi:hypothetical protein
MEFFFNLFRIFRGNRLPAANLVSRSSDYRQKIAPLPLVDLSADETYILDRT